MPLRMLTNTVGSACHCGTVSPAESLLPYAATVVFGFGGLSGIGLPCPSFVTVPSALSLKLASGATHSMGPNGGCSICFTKMRNVSVMPCGTESHGTQQRFV